MLSTGLFLVLLFGYLYLAWLLPLPDILQLQPTGISSKITDRHGQLLYEIVNPEAGRKTWLKLNEMPPLFVQAVLAAEDKNFYQHRGVDWGAVSRALFYNARQQDVTSGASTITQQLVRNMLGTSRERTLAAKVIEAAYAIRISHAYSREQILEQYLNTVYFGHLSYGAGQASRNFFNKNLFNLDLAELSLLAGLPQAPSSYNPLVNLPAAKKRQRYILNRMVAAGLVSTTEADQAAQEKLNFTSGKTAISAPHFVHQVMAEVERDYGEKLLYSGITIQTTLDLNLQQQSERIVDYQLKRLQDKNVTNAALLSVDAVTGQVLAWLGSRDYFDNNISGQVDLITSLRQPGSALKPFLYLLALKQGSTLATLLEDLPLQVSTPGGVYAPLNYDLDFHGPVRLREALANSFNIPAVRTQQKLGTADFLNFLRQLGLNTLDQPADYYGLALTLGGGEIRLLDLANAYFTLANYGRQKTFSRILSITDSNGKSIYQWRQPAGRPILGSRGEALSYLIISALSDAQARLASFGADSVLELSVPAAVKTGTTRNFRDNWTFGFSTSFLTAVWVGNADATPMENISGIEGAGPIWHDVMEYLHQYGQIAQRGITEFQKPAGLNQVSICAISGLLPGEHCQATLQEWFLSGTEPKEQDYYWQQFNCGSGQINQSANYKHFPVYPPPYDNWAAERGLGATTNCHQTTFAKSLSTPKSEPAINILSPLPGDSYEISPDLPLDSQKISLKVRLNPATLPSGASSTPEAVELLLDGRPIHKQPLTGPQEVVQFWPPTRGPHTLTVNLLNQGGSILTSKEANFLIR